MGGGGFPSKSFDNWVTSGPNEVCPECGGISGDHDDDCKYGGEDDS